MARRKKRMPFPPEDLTALLPAEEMQESSPEEQEKLDRYEDGVWRLGAWMSGVGPRHCKRSECRRARRCIGPAAHLLDPPPCAAHGENHFTTRDYVLKNIYHLACLYDGLAPAPPRATARKAGRSRR